MCNTVFRTCVSRFTCIVTSHIFANIRIQWSRPLNSAFNRCGKRHLWIVVSFNVVFYLFTNSRNESWKYQAEHVLWWWENLIITWCMRIHVTKFCYSYCLTLLVMDILNELLLIIDYMLWMAWFGQYNAIFERTESNKIRLALNQMLWVLTCRNFRLYLPLLDLTLFGGL